jgi:hypothetical protein
LSQASDKKAKILIAALELSGGDLTKTFTAEELLVAAWRQDPMGFGLRGFEREYPASEVIHREIGKRGPGTESMVDMGFLEQTDSRVYRLTMKGLQRASELAPEKSGVREKANRELEGRIRDILNHKVFAVWVKDPERPKSFREAGQFWGVAPGTPSKVIRDRIQAVDDLIEAARSELDRRNVNEMVDKHGKALFDREDLLRTSDFNQTLNQRFGSDLQLLGVEFSH